MTNSSIFTNIHSMLVLFIIFFTLNLTNINACNGNCGGGFDMTTYVSDYDNCFGGNCANQINTYKDQRTTQNQDYRHFYFYTFEENNFIRTYQENTRKYKPTVRKYEPTVRTYYNNKCIGNCPNSTFGYEYFEKTSRNDCFGGNCGNQQF